MSEIQTITVEGTKYDIRLNNLPTNFGKGTGENSIIENQGCIASDICSHAEGNNTQATSDGAHAEGNGAIASNSGAHAEGNGAIASGSGAHAEGYYTQADGDSSHSEGANTQANGSNAHAEGYYTQANLNAHAEGSDSQAIGSGSHAEGYYTKADGDSSHSEGSNTQASNMNAHAEGEGSKASGKDSHAEGFLTTAETYCLHTQGQYNKVNTGTADSYSATQNAMVIGNGTSNSALSNAFRIDFLGATYGLSAFNSSGADYAEYFEWTDANTNNEDRIGYFVELTDDGKIQKATSQNNVFGIVSGTAGVIGDSYEDQWNGMYDLDKYGRFQYEDVEITYPAKTVVRNGKTIITQEEKTITEKHIKLNPNYDNNKEYIPRSKRPEWDCIGVLGKIIVRDDGTCQINQKCKCNNNGIATLSDDNTGYKVLSRIDENTIKVWFR